MRNQLAGEESTGARLRSRAPEKAMEGLKMASLQEQALLNLGYGARGGGVFQRADDGAMASINNVKWPYIVSLYNSVYVGVQGDGSAIPCTVPGFESEESAAKYPLAREIATEYNKLYSLGGTKDM